jgi:peptidylprolyl isomerase
VNRRSFLVLSSATAASVALIAAGCGDGPDAPEAERVRTASGLEYIDQKVGDGPSPRPNQQVTVHYIGTLADGTKFDSSRDRGQPSTFAMTSVIPGFSEGLSTMKVGGRRTLYIPAALGYGADGRPPVIPPDADLIFDVELLAIQ